MNNHDWIELFDGRNLEHWHSDEVDAWSAVDGLLICRKTGVQLFSTGEAETLRNFELEMEVLAPLHSAGSLRFHARAAESSEANNGLEVVISARQGDHCQAGSLRGLRPVYKRLVGENEWFTLRIAVSGKSVRVWLNDALLVDYVEPARPAEAGTRRCLGEGAIALCCSSELSPRFRAIRLRRLSEIVAEQPAVDETYRRVMACHRAGIPVIDLHVHLKSGLTLEQTLAKSRRDGIAHGIAVNCGKGFPVQNDTAALEFCSGLGRAPVFAAMQAEGREWMQMFSHRAAASFDYIFTDSMTWSDNRGRRMRLWIPGEVGEIADPDEFMETLVARAVAILEGEPIDIYVNPTFLPAVLAADYERLWTESRMSRVIEAAARNQVAIELNDLYRLPSAQFVRLAKAAGCKFTLGTNNTGPDDLRRCEYGLETIERCGLAAGDFFVPGCGECKAIERKGHLLQE
jgi:hypothetical protein